MEIRDLELDGENLDHLSRHGRTERGLLQVVEDEDLIILRNKKSGTGQFKVIGRDAGGQLWSIILATTDQDGLWRPITGWPSTRGEGTIYRTRRRSW